GELLACGVDAGACERLAQLLARQEAAAFERAADDTMRTREQPCVEPVGPTHRSARRAHALCRQRLHPSQILRRDEMPRRTHDVRADDVAGIECPRDRGIVEAANALADTPSRRAELLCLYRAEPRD